MAVITIWTDLHCPWAYVSALRLHRMRDHLGAEQVIFDFRAWPLELVNEQGVPERIVRNEMAVLAQLESSAFSNYDNDSWPTTYLPAFEAQKWGYSLGQEVGEHFDLALRRAFFLHSRDLSLRHELLEVATSEGLNAEQLGEALDDGRFRKEVMADYEESKGLPIQGSPQVFLPDGTSHHNPGISHKWVRGIPVVESDHPSVYQDLIQAAATEE
ncbi:MAG: DsbA family protein [Actinomycetota bacterium]|nr:DsbA family protein [Actinomycetota bacterium]